MVLFEFFLKSKFDPNIHQKRTKLHNFKKISRGSMPPNPLPKRGDMQISKSQKKKFLAPPKILATPLGGRDPWPPSIRQWL